MFTPAVTSQLAEKALTGAAVHALSVRVATGGEQRDLEDYQLFRDGTDPAELALSLTAYAVALTWWYATTHAGRLDLLERATTLMLTSVSEHPDDAAELSHYRMYALWLTAAATLTADADALQLGHFACANDQVNLRTAVYADALVRSLLVAGHTVFGDPHTSAETLRNLMTTLAYAPVRA